MALNIPRAEAKARVIDRYKRTRRITSAAVAGDVPYGTAQRWLAAAGLIQGNMTASVEHGARHVVKGPDPDTIARVSRDPCSKCGVRMDVGCKHFPLQVEPERPVSAKEQAEALWSARP